MERNNKIKELINCISSGDNEAYIEKIQELDLTKEDFKGQIHFSKKKYTRTCIAKGEGYELILLAWSEGQKTAIHNHAGNEGLVYALDGEFKEVGYTLNEETNELEKQGVEILKENEVSYAEEDENEFHSIENINNGPSLSLHLYKEPIASCLVYDEKEDKIKTKHLAYDFV